MLNYSLAWGIPLGFTLAILPQQYASYIAKTAPEFKNAGLREAGPRDFIDRARRMEKKSPLVKRYLKAEAANANGFENLGFFSAAVVAGNAAGLPIDTMNALTAAYLASRIIYNWLYIFTTSESVSALRSASWLTGMGICLTILVKAGLVLNQK